MSHTKVPSEKADGPLSGLIVIDMTQWYAGPLATSWLGDLGANVIKVERGRIGDPTRVVDAVLPSGMSSYFAGLNRSKRSIQLDVSTPDGLKVARSLISQADILVENYRPGVMDRLGLGYESLRTENERLIYCAISSFGPSGPLAEKPGMDLIVQAMGGLMGLTGPVGGPPIRVGAPVADYVGSLQTVVGITVALHERQRSGLGQRVDIALLEGQIAMLSNFMTGYQFTNTPVGPVGDFHPQLAPYQVYSAKDSRVIVACLTEHFWKGLCRALKLEHLIVDPRFSRNIQRCANRSALNEILEPVIVALSAEELISRLEDEDVPCAPILTIGDLLQHPQVKHNQTIIPIQHPRVGTYYGVATPFRLNRSPPRVSLSAPDLGEHTEEVLREFGFDESDIKRATQSNSRPRSASTDSADPK